ncbi:MAG: phosphotransferase [Chitinivibrionales bacterium]|nr:phosphotransferase [Chitinivibrionales bacterium]MBD3396898.1 phosphotransferase [Chitinivibrionales bacterium]
MQNTFAGFNREILEGCVRKHAGGDNVPVRLNPIATGRFNTSFYVGLGQRNMVLRIAPPADTVFLFYERDMMLQEPSLHALILEKTDVPVAPIIALDTSREIIDQNYILMERLPGTALSQAGVFSPHAALRQVGKCLAQVHSLTATQFGYLGEHHPMRPRDSWRDAFTIMWRKLVDDIASVGHYDARESRMMKHLVDTHRHLFEECETAHLLHMDIWSQNILVDSAGNLTGIVDWDRALWGDPEIEFAVLDYCGVSEPAFWEGYSRRRSKSAEARLRNVFYLLYEIQKYIVIRQGRQNNRAGALAYKNQVMRVVERAFH